eukprot:1475739-Pyramimonas_sp.AAC.1
MGGSADCARLLATLRSSTSNSILEQSELMSTSWAALDLFFSPLVFWTAPEEAPCCSRLNVLNTPRTQQTCVRSLTTASSLASPLALKRA